MTYQPTKNLFAMDGMVGYEQVDPLTLVWDVRPGMRFHNGDPVDSEAVAFSFGRLAKLNDVFEARGDRSTHVRREGYDFVDSFEPTDDLTLTEHWIWPNADALVHRARHYYSFLNPRVVQEQGTLEGTYTAPDGTPEDVYSIQDLPFGSGSGPYVLKKRDETGTRASSAGPTTTSTSRRTTGSWRTVPTSTRGRRMYYRPNGGEGGVPGGRP